MKKRDRLKLYPRHQHQWSEYATWRRCDNCPNDPGPCACGGKGPNPNLLQCDVCDLEMPRNVVEAYHDTPTALVYVPGDVSEAEAEQIKAAIQTLPPDTDTRCSHQDGAGQCLDHQGHQGRHQPPNWVETIRTLVARCENFVPPTDCQSAGRDPQSPYSADGYCLSCKVRRVLQGDHQPPTPPLSVSED